jgi:hypothetical protein
MGAFKKLAMETCTSQDHCAEVIEGIRQMRIKVNGTQCSDSNKGSESEQETSRDEDATAKNPPVTKGRKAAGRQSALHLGGKKTSGNRRQSI